MMRELFDEDVMRKQLDRANGRIEFEKGKAEGRAEDKISVAQRFLSLGTISHEDIAKGTGLTLEKIRELSNDPSHAANR